MIAKEFGQMQYNLILLNLQSLPEEEKTIKLQRYFNELKAIVNVSSSYAEIMESKYLLLMFAYQELFNIKGGEIPKLDGIDTNVDVTDIENEIIGYLKNRRKNYDTVY